LSPLSLNYASAVAFVLLLKLMPNNKYEWNILPELIFFLLLMNVLVYIIQPSISIKPRFMKWDKQLWCLWVWFRPVPHTDTNTDQIIIYAATSPNEPQQYILTHFNNCNFSKAQTVCSMMMMFHTETCRSFLMSILMRI
jgi:hypothetical protein